MWQGLVDVGGMVGGWAAEEAADSAPIVPGLALTPVRPLWSHLTFVSGSAEERHGGPLVRPSFHCFSDPGGARPGHFTAYPELFLSEASGLCTLGGLV